jgi:MFS family permease
MYVSSESMARRYKVLRTFGVMVLGIQEYSIFVTMIPAENKKNRQIALLIIVAALGYFVDIYDLVLFGVVKAESLDQIMTNASPDAKAAMGKFLFNMQMLGMLIGGLLWGILGDKKGRLKVLFGSILLYSVANIANAFVTDTNTYTFVRIIAGIGLAGELGAGITLVSEMMSKEKRGYGTMIIVTFGALGAVVASLVGMNGDAIGHFIKGITGSHLANWQVAYILGGTMGLVLLLMRVGTIESAFFKEIKQEGGVKKGDLRLIFGNASNRIKYLHCILIGIPIWYVIGLLIMNSKDHFGPWLGVENVENGLAVMYAYIGLSFGDLLSGLLSQVFNSRKLVVYLYLCFTLLTTVIFLFVLKDISVNMYYLMCFLLGTGTGYWAIFVTIAAEQFGTNIRSTAANTIPNFVRGSVNIIVLLFGLLLSFHLSDGLAALLVGLLFIAIAFYSISRLKETFGKDLDYLEG